ncbi:dTDP-4-dehydrorhamnose reductase [Aliiroseovarius sp. 2305UL8-7]|uniref:dTDP-4-dehydrorhamnose reductase n=1 Tax=Aliiroseovarius conchicola TaxID=3121637 RepID=UPI0035277E94
MKVLVFGKTGQVATELRKFDNVRALGRGDADLTDPDACAQIIHDCSDDVVINAAAYTAVDAAEGEENLATIVNGRAPAAMAQAAKERGIPFLHISTDYVFDGTGTALWTPADPTSPVNAYGRSKLAGENAIRDIGGAYAILRTSWVFSAHGANFVKTMMRLSEQRDELSIVADQIGGPTSAEDIAEALMAIAPQMRDWHTGGTYHFSGQPAVSWAEFAEEIFRQAGRSTKVHPIPTSEFPTPAARPTNSRMDGTSTLADFGVVQPDWKTALGRVLVELGHVQSS